MRIIYGNEVNVVVEDDTDPVEAMNLLKESYSELSNAKYNISTEGDERVMRVTLDSGRKA
jgi:hypothetical protein